MKKLMLVFCIFLTVSSIWAYFSDDDDFVLGCYSYLKPFTDQAAMNNALLDYMQSAHYNSTIWNLYSNLSLGNTLLTNITNHRLDSFITDYYNGFSGDLVPEIYIAGRMTHWEASAVFSDQKFPALQQELVGRICCSEKA